MQRSFSRSNYIPQNIINCNYLKQFLLNESCKEALDEKDRDINAEKFIHEITTAITKFTDSKKIISKENKTRKLWITNSVMMLIKRRDSLRRLSILNPCNHEYLYKYKSYRNSLNN